MKAIDHGREGYYIRRKYTPSDILAPFLLSPHHFECFWEDLGSELLCLDGPY